ncbi:cytochrome P450 [Mycobacterium sp. Y57]|uniref:cytochrome P450 n=1 Tax=Mycolicibacterium xanthum TaxID=2796469 RepID=UPI001C843EA0|nr:cytochrome P450 [Mycolicibacterium xanthum]MBX7434586.1 cytochrome P450 [Mycolicibacterium xanthum]
MPTVRGSAEDFEVDPDWADIWFGAVHPMQIEVPRFHEALQMIDERGGVAPAWFFPGMPCYVLTSHDDVHRAFLDTHTFSPRKTQEVMTFPILGPTFLGYEGREHDLHRNVVARQFTKRRSEAYVPTLLEPQAHAVIDGFCARGDADLMGEFGKQYPLAVIGGLLGIPIDDWDRMSAWASDLILGSDPDHQQQSARAFREFLLPHVDSRRGRPADDILSLLANGEVDGKALTQQQIASFMLLLFPAGADTTWLGIGNMMSAILTTPGALEALSADPELRHRAVEETLRWAPPVALVPRITARDIEIRGVGIPADSLCLLGIAAANRDPSRFREPASWILDRRPNKHISFSFGEHFCLGAHIARGEMRSALDAILDRLPGLRLVEEPTYWGASIRGPDALRVTFDPSEPGRRERR